MSIGKEKEEVDAESALRALFARNLRTLRIQRNISQYDLAERSGLHRNFVSEVEREIRNVTLSNIGRLARGLGIEPMELFRPVDENADEVPRQLSTGHRRKRGEI